MRRTCSNEFRQVWKKATSRLWHAKQQIFAKACAELLSPSCLNTELRIVLNIHKAMQNESKFSLRHVQNLFKQTEKSLEKLHLRYGMQKGISLLRSVELVSTSCLNTELWSVLIILKTSLRKNNLYAMACKQ